MIKAVIFDMDGVIIDSEPLWEKTAKVYFERIGKKFPSDKSFSRFIDINFRGRRQKEVIAIMKKKFKLSDDYDQIMSDRLEILFSIFDKELKLLPGVLTLIKKFRQKKIPMVVASSSPPAVINYAMKRFKLRPYFKEIISGDNVKRSKPYPDIFIKAAKSFKNVKKEEILVVEDSYSGVLAAKNAKMKCLAIHHAYADKNYFKKADVTVDNFRGIKIKEVINL